MSEITVRKANVVLRVPEEQKDEYLNKGFDVVDSRSNAVIEHSIPRDANALRVMVEELQEKIKVLIAENEDLKSKLSLGKAEDKAPTKEPEESNTEEDDFFEDSVEEEFTPINKRNPKKTTKK